MALTPLQDIVSIKAILDTDPYLNSKGFLPNNVFKIGRPQEELSKETLAIYIYSLPAYRQSNGIFASPMYSIDVVGSEIKSNTIMASIEQVVALLHNKDIGNLHILELLDPPMQVDAPQGVVIYNVSFTTNATIFNKIKTV